MAKTTETDGRSCTAHLSFQQLEDFSAIIRVGFHKLNLEAATPRTGQHGHSLLDKDSGKGQSRRPIVRDSVRPIATVHFGDGCQP
jgi:hypothetical protein